MRQLHQYIRKKTSWLTDTKMMRWLQQLMPRQRRHPMLARIGWGLMALFVLTTLFFDIINQRQSVTSYALSASAEQLLPVANKQYAAKISYDSKTGKYEYNKGYQAQAGGTSLGGPKFIASVGADLEENGAVVTDPVNETSVTLTPQFATRRGEQDGNRLVYPLIGRDAQKVYTLGATGMKEDIILNKYQGDAAEFSYKLGLPSGTEARLESNGTIAVYGVDSTLLGNVTTGSDADAKLLENARKNGAKTTLLFMIPAPYVKETNVTGVSKRVKAHYGYKNGIITVYVEGMKGANYPLTIDPTIYIDTAQKLMLGNNESNIEFDATNELIQKGSTTGARINSWTNSGTLAAPTWDQAMAMARGYVYSVGGQQENGHQNYTSGGTSSFTVPAGVTSKADKAWGGGGGGGGGGSTGTGGAGGGGGFTTASLSVTPGDVLTIYVGGGGGGGSVTGNTSKRSGSGGGGGGYSAVYNSTTSSMLIVAAGGGGGGGSRLTTTGSAGGAGGGSNGVVGSTTYTNNGAGGGYGTTTSGLSGSGGSGGTGGNNSGSAGSSLQGGGGAGGSSSTSGADGTGGTAGVNGGGGGGLGNINTTRAAGGGGGGGLWGGGGGGATSSTTNSSGGGGGGGSGYPIGSTSAGSGINPAGNTDADWADNAGTGGAGGGAVSAGTAGTNGRVIITYGSRTVSNKVYWAQFNSNTKEVTNPNPGNGACAGWCNDTAYDLPVGLRGLSLVAYNGFLYAIGGTDGPTRQSTVYVAKLGANGEPQLWHPSGGTPTYWYQATSLTSARSYLSAYAYNNKLYILGGQTNASTGGITTVEVADILPTGALGPWSTTGMQTLPSTRWSHGVQIYNDVMYLIGGFSGTTAQNTVYYSKLNSDGTMNAWTSTAAFSSYNARGSMGGSMTAEWGGYIYLGGGCSVLVSGYCSTIESDVLLASINADGSLADWNSIANITNPTMGYQLLAWQGGLYSMGGCQAQNTTNGYCTTALDTVQYGVINHDGDASTVSNSSAYSASLVAGNPCSGYAAGSQNLTNCDLPAAGDNAGQVGQMSSMVVINNGYIYNIGGCVIPSSSCNSNMSGNIAYASLNSNGLMTAPATCTGTYSALWCVDSTNRINGTNGIAAAGAAVFNNTIYIVGGVYGSTWMSNIWRVGLNNDGSLSGAWQSQTFSSVGLGTGDSTGTADDARGYMYVFTRANPSLASTYPGNLYILGGCYATNGIGCNVYNATTNKCNIAVAGTISGCTAAGQLQIDATNVSSGNQGLGLMAGTVYANRVYLVGGSCAQDDGGANDPCGSNYAANRKDTIYAKIDNSGNIVANSTTGTYANVWAFATAQMSPVRRRAMSFGYNGYIYSLAGYSGSASLQDLLFSKIDVSTGDMGPWGSSGVVVTPRWDLRAIVSGGYVYAIGGCASGAAPANCTAMQPQIQTFQLYNNDSGAAAAYNLGTSNPGSTAQRIGGSSVILNGYLYYAGGCTDIACSATSNAVNYIALDAYGNQTGSWMTSTLPAARAWGKLVAAGGGLYYVGGQSGTALSTAQTSVYYASVSGGTPTWGTATNGIPAARTQAGITVWNNHIYVVGGYNASSAVQSTVYVSPLLSGGDITSAWATNSTSFNIARAGLTAIAYANNIYIFGGYDGTNYLLDSQFASIGYKQGTICQGNVAGNCTTSGTVVTGTGTNWVSTMVGSTLVYPDGATATITAVNSTTSLTVSVARALSAGSTYTIQDGSIGGSWTYSTSLPGPLRDADGFAANGYIYLVGGRSAATTCTPNTLVTPVSANTSINSLDTNGMADDNTPTGIGEWYETNQRYSGDRYGSGVAYANGKIYVMGGGCSALVTTSTPDQWLYQSTLYSQPQIAKYSIMIDTDSDVYATTWLANGVDNSTGAQWSLSYRSMNNPLQTDTSKACGGSVMTTWGTQVDMGSIILGRPGAYVIKNNSGTTISCARYFYMSLTVDVTQSFGYPEDVTRGPTIADLSLFYTSDASKRMLHGKTFSGGLQQPLDAQCRQSNNQLSAGVNNPLYSDCPNP